MLGLANPTHLMFLLAVLLLVFGAKRLPEIGSSLGAGLRGFKDSVSGEAAHAAQLHHAHAPVEAPAPVQAVVAVAPVVPVAPMTEATSVAAPGAVQEPRL